MMSAFNKRFTPFEIWGAPGAGFLGIIMSLVGGLMFFLMPMPLNIIFGIISLIAFFVALVAFYMRDDFQWITLIILSKFEARASSQFGREP